MDFSTIAEEYNKKSLSSDEVRRHQDPRNLDFQPALRVGRPAPDFTALDLDGNSLRLADFRSHKHVVLEFGCITAPVFINDIAFLNYLHFQLQGHDIQFLIVYTRESVPGGERYQPHNSIEQKLAYAKDLQRLENVQFPVVVDTLEGDAHRAYGLWPSPVYVINKEGMIVYKASWLFPEELELVLRQLLRWEKWQADGERPLRNAYSEVWTALRTNRVVHKRVFDRTGGEARAQASKAFGYDPVSPKK
jgi:Iodothyronine deiodinase